METLDEIKNHDKLFKKFEDSKLHIDKGIYNPQDINQGTDFWWKEIFDKKIGESIIKPKDLWKALKFLGLSNKISSCEVNAFKINIVAHDGNSVLKTIAQLWQATL